MSAVLVTMNEERTRLRLAGELREQIGMVLSVAGIAEGGKRGRHLRRQLKKLLLEWSARERLVLIWT